MNLETSMALVEPVAEVRYAFDEQKERAAFVEQVERYRGGRDQAFDARLEMGKILLRAQQAWPNIRERPLDSRHGRYSPKFIAFVATLTGMQGAPLSLNYVRSLLVFARNPIALEKIKQRSMSRTARGVNASSIALARKMRLALRNGATLEELETALTEIIGDAQVQSAA